MVEEREGGEGGREVGLLSLMEGGRKEEEREGEGDERTAVTEEREGPDEKNLKLCDTLTLDGVTEEQEREDKDEEGVE